VLICLLPACGREPVRHGSARDQERPIRGGEFRISDYPGLSSWDPHTVTDVISAVPLSQVYEGLVQCSPHNPDSVVPALASRWEISTDRRCYTFHLRRNVRFPNDPCFRGGRGRPIKAEDIRYSLERALGVPGRHTLPSAAMDIQGVGAFQRGASREIAGVQVRDDSTLILCLSRPRVSFLACLTLNWGYVVPPEADRFYGRDIDIHPVGAGPFRLARWEPDEVIVLVRNENYWECDARGDSLPYLDRVVFVLSSPLQVPGLGGVHVHLTTNLFPDDSYPDRPEKPAFRNLRVTRYSTIFFGWRMDRASVWTRDRRLRQAVACAFRRPETEPTQLLAKCLLPPGFPGYDPSSAVQAYDPERARRLLAAAGHPGGRGLPTLAVSSVLDEAPLGSMIQQGLQQIGIAAELHELSKPEHWDNVDAGHLEFFRSGWLADYPDPESFFEIFYSGSRLNLTHFADACYDSLFELLLTEPDRTRRFGHCRELEGILLVEAPACFIRHDMNVMLVAPEVRNFEYSMNPLWRKFYKYIWLAKG
jgi:peptide/nickel transport system substrate-binding protein